MMLGPFVGGDGQRELLWPTFAPFRRPPVLGDWCPVAV